MYFHFLHGSTIVMIGGFISSTLYRTPYYTALSSIFFVAYHSWYSDRLGLVSLPYRRISSVATFCRLRFISLKVGYQWVEGLPRMCLTAWKPIICIRKAILCITALKYSCVQGIYRFYSMVPQFEFRAFLTRTKMAQACRVLMHKLSADKKGGRYGMSRFFFWGCLKSGRSGRK